MAHAGTRPTAANKSVGFRQAAPRQAPAICYVFHVTDAPMAYDNVMAQSSWFTVAVKSFSSSEYMSELQSTAVFWCGLYCCTFRITSLEMFSMQWNTRESQHTDLTSDVMARHPSVRMPPTALTAFGLSLLLFINYAHMFIENGGCCECLGGGFC